MLLIYGKCNHFWRKRTMVPRHPPYVVGETGIQMPPLTPLCSSCIERIAHNDSSLVMESGHDGTLASAVQTIRTRAADLEAATGMPAKEIEEEIAEYGMTPGEWGIRHGLDPMFFYQPTESESDETDVPKDAELQSRKPRKKKKNRP